MLKVKSALMAMATVVAISGQAYAAGSEPTAIQTIRDFRAHIKATRTYVSGVLVAFDAYNNALEDHYLICIPKGSPVLTNDLAIDLLAKQLDKIDPKNKAELEEMPFAPVMLQALENEFPCKQ